MVIKDFLKSGYPSAVLASLLDSTAEGINKELGEITDEVALSEATTSAIEGAIASLRAYGAEARKRWEDVQRVILSVENPLHRDILAMRYLKHLTDPEVQRGLSGAGVPYCIRSIRRFSSVALAEAEKVWRSVCDE